MKMANMDDYFDVVIVGTGAAGLYCALNLPARYRILLLTKQKADESDSFLAQGGICMQHGEADYRPFFDDTMRAGHYENNPATVDLMIRSSNSIIRDLVRRGVRFARFGHRRRKRIFLWQYRIILSADTASEVRQMLSQKRR